ncbi:MAG: HD domain-containing phosphohydrolase [Candidatus Zixiibacteriota bacterium]
MNTSNPDNTLSKSNEKWVLTLQHLLELSKQASNDFDYERAYKHLISLEELWDSKGFPTISLDLRFELHNEKGKVLTKLGRNSEAVAEYQILLDYCQDRKLIERRVEVFLEIGQLLSKIGEHDRALGYVHRALSGYRKLKNPLGICKSLRNLGVVYIELGEFEDAETAYEEAIEISGREKLTILNADLYNNFGTIKNIKGDWKAALECYSISSSIYEKEGEIRKHAYTLNNTGITLLERGRYLNAYDSFLSALRVAERLKDESLILTLNINMIDISLKLSNVDEALQYCTSAEEYLLSKELKNNQLVETKKLAGKIMVAKKDYETAAQRFDEALEISQELGVQYLESEVLFEKGNLLFITERHMEALHYLEKAFQMFHQLDAAGKVEKTEDLIAVIEDLYLKVFEAMASEVDQKDPYTKGHSDRVANLALVLAQKLGLSDKEIKELVAGGLLHDIGKLKIDDDVLKKTGKLTPEEFEHIKMHPNLGVRIMSEFKLPWEILPLIRHHHEKYDGSGYPSGLAGELIPIGARIICVADVFDALTSDRPYRKAFSAEKTLRLMNSEMTGSFDSVVLDALIDLVNTNSIDYIINRQTDKDEMYRIWAQCRFSQPEQPITS